MKTVVVAVRQRISRVTLRVFQLCSSVFNSQKRGFGTFHFYKENEKRARGENRSVISTRLDAGVKRKVAASAILINDN